METTAEALDARMRVLHASAPSDESETPTARRRQRLRIAAIQQEIELQLIKDGN